MTKAAFELFEETFRDEQNRYQARRIRNMVTQARQTIPSAGPRWPFELLQNALDAGPRVDSTTVAIRLNCEQAKVVFEHDGIPFTSSDLTALLSGGSNKDLESEETTGRFGTGFLVTHVLAERTTFRGLLEAPNGYEQFDLLLDRGGDEEAILQNMKDCRESIRSATPVLDLDGAKSARFEYDPDDENPMTLGIDSLRAALPYIYGTRRVLGRVELLNGNGDAEVWQPSDVTSQVFEDSFVEKRSLRIHQDGICSPELRIFRFMTNEQSSTAALMLVERTLEGWKVVPPEANVPRVYREYPLSGSGFLPVNVILDGKFDPDQERSKLLLTEEDKGLVEEAFAAAVAAVKYAFANEWEDAHLLAKVHAPTRGFGTGSDAETVWWHEQLASFATRVAELPIVDCSSRMLPAITPDGAYADFIVPSLLVESSDRETTVDRMWPLVEATSKLLPPRKELAEAWSDIASGWDSLGLPISRIAVKDLPRWAGAGAGAETLDDLKVDCDAKQWIALFLDVTGECWKSRSGMDPTVLDNLLPDQNQRLRSPSDLSRDNGIPDSLKDICKDIGLDIRRRLILTALYDVAAQNELRHLRYVLDNSLPNAISEDYVIQRAVKSLVELLPEDKQCEETTVRIQQGSVKLLSYLWEAKREQAVSSARQIPLIASSGRSVRWGPRRMMMAPVQCWHKSAQPFSNAYPPDRILADMYTGSCSEDLPDCVEALVAWGIVIADPVHTDTPPELTSHRLAELSITDTEGVSVPNNEEEFSQIALLQPEVLNRCREGIEEARALLGLVLCHVAPHDPNWTKHREVRGRKSGQNVNVPVAGALWLADLRIRPWVPILGEDGNPTPMPADAITLRTLLDPKWLEHNDEAIKLLSEWFEFDQLELRLLGIEPDNERRERLRDGLASLVQLGGADPEIYLSLAASMKEQKRRSRDINRFRCMGIGVQKAIKSAFEAQQLDPELVLDLELIDHGFDYEVNVFDNLSTRLPVGQYLLEIKATTTGRPHLSPLQAETASKRPDNYLLCVVDLRSLRHEDLSGEWPASIVEPLAKIVPDIGSRVQPTYSLVEKATNNSIAVRNESALRYAVPNEVWEAGISISDWVAALPHQ